MYKQSTTIKEDKQVYVIRRTDRWGGWVAANPNLGGSYTKKLRLAKVYSTRAQAEAHMCPHNEVVERVEDIMEEAQ